MSNELYLRLANLKIGKSAAGVSKSLDMIDHELFSGFRITFDIGKTSDRHPNTSRVGIYNLNANRRKNLESSKEEGEGKGTGLVMALEAGYLGFSFPPLLSEIFTGDVKLVRSERVGADIITYLESGDSEVALTTMTVNETFGPNTPSTTVIGVLAEKLGKAVGTIMPGLPTIFQNGLSLTGLASDNLDILTRQAGLEWSIQDGELNIIEPKLPTLEEPVLVSNTTGLIGLPTRTEKGLEFTSLINPLIKVGRGISLFSDGYSGLYKCVKATYKGDTHQGDFKMTVEVT